MLGLALYCSAADIILENGSSGSVKSSSMSNSSLSPRSVPRSVPPEKCKRLFDLIGVLAAEPNRLRFIVGASSMISLALLQSESES